MFLHNQTEYGINTYMNYRAWWINNKGKSFELRGGTHIEYVIGNPKKFGETDDTIRESYEKYNEQMPHEGKGREEIMKRVM